MSAHPSGTQPPQQPFFSPQMQVPGQPQINLLNMSVPHIMPTPTDVPWNATHMPWKAVNPDNGIMQFNAFTERRGALHQKRKSDVPVPLPTKQFITEEIITAHFNGLHISSDHIQNANSALGDSMDGDAAATTSNGRCFTNLTYRDYQVTAKELEEKLKNANRITIAEEIKKFTDEQRHVAFLPGALVSHTEKPCNALVLWKPPPVLELLQNNIMSVGEQPSIEKREQQPYQNDSIEDEEFYIEPDADAEIDDFDNNNTFSVDFNNFKTENMDSTDEL